MEMRRKDLDIDFFSCELILIALHALITHELHKTLCCSMYECKYLNTYTLNYFT